MKLIQTILIGAAACALSLPALAQWQWVDQNGRKVYSDRPPPPEIPEKNIRRHGGTRSPDPSGATSQPLAASDSTNGAANEGNLPKPSGVDKGLAEKKRQAAEAEAAKRKAEEAKVAQARAENCVRARRVKSNLEAGTRIFRTNDMGEREVLDEATRAAELQRIQSVMDSDCQ